MNTPKISVLVPMYNRKHYIQDCINSVLNQTFKDYEIIIRDNVSTDGGFEFVQQRYANEIAEGKIKLFRNDENIGFEGSTNRLMYDATGEYFYFLHTDDMILPHALQHHYETAKATNADIVHESYFLLTSKDPIGKPISHVTLTSWITRPAPKGKLILVSNNPIERFFIEWLNRGIYWDIQHNLIRRQFMLEDILAKGIVFKLGPMFFALWYIMLAKVIVKTLIACYVRRPAPDSGSGTTARNSLSHLEHYIKILIEIIRSMDEIFDKIDFFRNNEEYQYMAKAYTMSTLQNFWITDTNVYKDGITPEIQRTVAKVFKEYFGKDYFYAEFLFNLLQVQPHGKRVDQIVVPPPDSRNS